MIYFQRSRSVIDIISIRHRKFLRNLDSRNVTMMYNKIDMTLMIVTGVEVKLLNTFIDKSKMTFDVKFYFIKLFL